MVSYYTFSCRYNKYISSSLDSEDGFRTCCRNVSRQQQSFSGLQSPILHTWIEKLKGHLIEYKTTYAYKIKCGEPKFGSVTKSLLFKLIIIINDIYPGSSTHTKVIFQGGPASDQIGIWKCSFQVIMIYHFHRCLPTKLSFKH